MPRLTEEQRYHAVLLSGQGHSTRDIAKQIECDQSSVVRLLDKCAQTGSVRDRDRSGRPRTAMNAENIAACKREYRKGFNSQSPIKSVRKLGVQLGIAASSVSRIYRNRLKLKSLKRQSQHNISDETRRKRLLHCQQLQRKYGYRQVQRMWFSDKSFFPLCGVINRQNKRLRDGAPPESKTIVQEHKFPKGLLIWGAVSKMGKLELMILPVRARVSGRLYRTMIREHIVPELERVCGARRYIFQQDGAPAHCENETQTLCRVLMSDFISEEFWPPYSADLNPLDYRVWEYVKEKVYATAPRDMQDLEDRIRFAWAEMPQKFIDSAINIWRTRLAAVIHNDGAHVDTS